jgi:protein TonB
VVVPPTVVLDHLSPIEVGGPVMPEETIRIGGAGGIAGPSITGSPIGAPIEGIRDVGSVDHIPSVLGNPPAPHYPNALRESGIAGRVVARFVIDTLGRAEMDGVVFIESTHPLFADAVRRALTLYRFTPGEASGQKVRTMVQMPFAFTLR